MLHKLNFDPMASGPTPSHILCDVMAHKGAGHAELQDISQTLCTAGPASSWFYYIFAGPVVQVGRQDSKVDCFVHVRARLSLVLNHQLQYPVIK